MSNKKGKNQKKDYLKPKTVPDRPSTTPDIKIKPAQVLEISFKDCDTVSQSIEKKKPVRVTDDMLTIYEYTAMISYRAKRLMMGDEPRVKWDQPHDPIAIAKFELEQRVIPVLLIRKIPDKLYESGFREEVWNVREMRVRDS